MSILLFCVLYSSVELNRKQDLRELKVLQREEQKEAQILQEKIRQDQELMEKRFDVQREVTNCLLLLLSCIFEGIGETF